MLESHTHVGYNQPLYFILWMTSAKHVNQERQSLRQSSKRLILLQITTTNSEQNSNQLLQPLESEKKKHFKAAFGGEMKLGRSTRMG